LAWDRKQKTTETDGNVGFGMGQPTFPSVSIVFCFLSHAKTFISISLCRLKTTETDGNVGFGMGQETENERD
jgi:hypothetical protein